jgi:hypothetical protein
MQLMLRSWTRFLARLFPGRRTSRQRLPRWWAGARKLACPTLRRGRKRRLLRQPLRPLALQGLEPRQLLSASLQVWNGGTQYSNGGSDSFGTVAVGASDSQTWTLKNVGSSTLTISSDSPPIGFSSSNSTPINIAPQQSTSFSVTMSTSSTANYSGNLTLSTNDPSNANFMVSLSGTVQQGSGGGTIELFDGSTQLTNGSNDSFPSVTVGSSDSKSFNVQNVGSSTLTVSSVNLPSSYTLNGSLPLNVSPNQSASFTVSLNTSTAGTFNGQMLVSSSDSTHSPLAVNISGTVTAPPAPSMSLSDGSTSIANGGSDSFGSVIQGTTASKTFTVSNTGTASLTVSSISLPSDYTLQTSLPLTVAAGGSTTFIVNLGTSSTGTFAGQMTMATNDQHNQSYNVSLSATVNVQPPVIEVFDGQNVVPNNPNGSPDSFGSTYVGTPIQKQFDIANNGSTNISITSGSLSLPAGYSLVGSWPTTISPHGSIPFTVQFNAIAVGTATGELSFSDSDPGGSVYEFPITATATVPPPAIAVADGSSPLSNGGSDPFGSTVVGTPIQKSFSVTNTGGQTLTVSSASVPAGFVVNSSLPMNIAPAESAVFQVTMQASSAGSSGGPLVIGSNASGNNAFTVNLSGTVTGGASLEVFDGSTQLTNGASDSLGNVTVGSTASKTLTLTNAGGGPLVVNSASGSSGLYVNASLPLTIPAGQCAQVTISDYVYAAGGIGGQVVFQTNDQSNPTFVVNISATASGGGSLQLFDGGNQFTSGATDDQGIVPVGGAWTKTLTVSNSGMGSLTISSVSLPSGYTLNTSLPLTVGPYQTASLVLGLNTSTAGTYSGPMVITSDDANNPTYTIDLTAIVGSALAGAAFELFDGSTQLFNGDSDTFASVSAGVIDAKQFTVSVPGNAYFGMAEMSNYGGVTINSVNLPPGFYLTTPLPLTVNPGQPATLDVRLESSTSGTYSGPMTIGASAASGSGFGGYGGPYPMPLDATSGSYTMTVNLSGTVTASQSMLTVLDGSATIPNGTGTDSFGTTTVGSPVEKSFVIQNSGSSVVALSSLTLPGGFSLVGSFPTSVAANGSAAFELQLNAASAGTVSGRVAFEDSENGGSSYSFAISGTVNPPVYNGPPAISVAATSNADEATLTPGTFTISTNEPGAGTSVRYLLTGTAIPGVDYVPPPLATTITSTSPSSVVKITPLDNGPFNAVRQEIILPPAKGGTYTLSLGGDITVPLAYNANAAAVQAALATLPNVGAGNVSVAGMGTAAQPFVAAWKGNLLSSSVAQLTADASNLQGALQASVDVTADGGPPTSAVEEVGFTTTGTTSTSDDVLYEQQFTLSFEGQTTPLLAGNAAASTVQSALEALSTVGMGNVNVVAAQTTGGEQTYLVYFQGALSDQSVPQITVAIPSSSSSGPPLSAVEAMTTAGSAGQNASQIVSLAGATGGNFKLALDNNFTTALAYNASDSDVATALAPLVGAGNVAVTGNDGGPWTITFVGTRSDQPVDALTVDTSQLTGGQIETRLLPAVNGPLTVTLQMLPSLTVDGVVSYVILGQSSATIQITDAQPAMTVSEGGNNIANGGSVNFGTTSVGQSVSETFTITNSGTDILILDPTSLTLPNGFTLTGTFPSSIAAGASANFTLQLSAATIGPLSGSVSFSDNDLANTVFNFTVQGNVSQPVPQAAVDLYGPGRLTLTPVPDGTGSVNFGQTNLNVPINEDFRIDNLGSATLTLTPSSLNLPTGFALVGRFPSSVLPGKSQDFTLQFQAISVGTVSNTVSFATNDSANSPYSSTVSGTVNPPAPTIEVFDRGSLLKSGVSTVNFTTVAAGTANPATETLTITNAGNAQLNLGAASVTPSGAFSVVTPFASPVPVGGSTTMVIQLNDSTAGNYSATLSFGTNDSTANPFTVTLNGQVLPAPAIKVYDGSTLIASGTGSDDFGATSQGAPLIKNFTIVNTGSNTISITPSSLSIPQSGFSVASPLPPSLLAGQSATFAIELTAGNIGTYSGPVSFNDTDTGNDPYTFQISGQVVPPGPTNVTITGFQLVNNTDGTASDPITYDPRVSGAVNGTFTSGYVVVQFDDSGSGTPQGSTSHITSSGTSFTYDPRTGDPSLSSGSVNLHYRIASFSAAGVETDGPWSDYQFTLIPVPTGAHVDHLTLVNDTGTSATDGLTYDPRVTGVVNGPFVGNSAQVDFTIIPGAGSQATGVVSGVLFAGQTFVFNPETADPALAGYAGPLTLQYYAVDLDASGNVVHTGTTLTLIMTLYAPTPQVSISGFGLLDDTDPSAPTLSTADPRVTGTVSGVPSGETVSVEFSHHGDGVVNGSVAITPSTLTFTYDPRAKETDLANYVGPLNLEYRTVEIDSNGGEIDGPWTSYPFNMEQATSPATIQNLQLSNVTISAGPPPATSDPTLSGTVTGTTISAPPTVQIDTTGGGVPDGSVTAGSNGAFTIMLANLPFGNATVYVRAVEYDSHRTIYLYGAWTSITFDYQPPPAPAITSFTLADDTGGTANPGHTTNDAMQGTIATPPAGDSVQVEFDTIGNGTAVASVPVSGTSFSFTPDWLPFGQVTVEARTVLLAGNGVVLSRGNWTPLTFTYLGTPGTAPTISVQLANQTGTSGGLPTASDPTLTGAIAAASGNAYQTVEYDLNGDGVPDGTTTTAANGNFTFTPQGLTAGTVTVGVRAKAWDSQSQGDIEGAWQTITFVYQPAVQQPVTVSLSLANNLADSTSTPAATDPTVVGQLAVANPQSAPANESVAYLTVQLDTNAGTDSPNYAPNASTTVDTNGAFQFTPSGLAYGSVSIAARAQYYDYTHDSMTYGPWTTFTFNYEQLTYIPPTIDSLTLASDTGGSSNPGQTANPTLTGHVSGDTWAVAGSPSSSAPQSATTFIEFDTTGSGQPDGYAWPDANGNFVYRPKYLSYGSVTINSRVESWSPTQNTLVSGPWSPLSFTYVDQADTAPVLTSLGLADDSTGLVTTATTSTDSSPVIAGQVTYQGALAGITIQFDTTGGTTPNATATTDDYGRFQFTPSGLTSGTVTVDARTYVVDDVTRQVLIGPWTPFTFTWQPPAASPLSIGSLTLANGTTDSSGNLSASDPTVTGQVTGDGDPANQIIQFDTNAGSQSAGSYAPNASTTTDSGGNFTYTPTGLSAGPVTIAARVEDTAADGTPIYSPWTSLTFTYTPSATTSVSQLVLANPAVVNGSANPSIASDPTVTGMVAPTVPGGGASIAGVTVEFDTTGDGQADASTTTNSHGQFTFTPGVYQGIVTITACTEDWINGAETPSAWVPLTFVYASDPNSAATQTELTTLSQANATLSAAQSSHDSGLASSQSNYTSAETTAATAYHKAEASATGTDQSTLSSAESTFASQTASANGTFNSAAGQAASNFANSISSFTGNAASYALPGGPLTDLLRGNDQGAGANSSLPPGEGQGEGAFGAPPVPTADDSYQPTPPVPAPTYSGPTFNVEEDAGYQAGVTTAETTYNTSIQTASGNYDIAVVSSTDTYNQSVELGKQQWRQSMAPTEGTYNTALATALAGYESWSSPNYGNLFVYWQAVAEATQPLTQATALADQAYALATAQAQQIEDDSLAQAAHDQAYAVADAESTLSQAVANANAAAFAGWAAVEGTPWAQYQSQLAANEAAFFGQDAPAQAAMAKAEADAQLTKAQAIDQATYDDEQTVANALAAGQVSDSTAQEQLTLANLGAQMLCHNQDLAAWAAWDSASAQIAAQLQAAILAAGNPSSPGYQTAVAAAEAAAQAESAAITQMRVDTILSDWNQQANAEIANDQAAEPTFEQDAYNYDLAQANAEAGFHQANANADRDAIIATAEADQAFSDADAGYQGSLDVANAQAEQSFETTVSNQYATAVQTWAASDGSPWAALQAALASNDATYTQTVAQANVNHVAAMSTANTNWTVADDAAEEQQTSDDAGALASSVAAAAAAQISAATSVLNAVKQEGAVDVPEQAAFDVLEVAARTAESEADFAANSAVDTPEAALSFAQTINPPAVNLVQDLDAQAVSTITAQGGANEQVNDDEASAAYTLALAEADDAKTEADAEAQADETLAEDQASADMAQSEALATAQANLDQSTTADQQTYNVAIANELASQTAALAASDPMALTDDWSAVASAGAIQAIAEQTATNSYETAAAAADVQLADDQATADYNYSETTSAADLLETQQADDAVHTQAYSDAQYEQQAATAAASSLSQQKVSTVEAQNDDASSAAQIRADWLDDILSANVTAADAGNTAAAQAAELQTLINDGQTLGPEYGQAGIALAQALGDGNATVATDIGSEATALAGQLADDANTEAEAEQAATLAEAQTTDAASVTRAAALATAQQNYATASGNAQIAETATEGTASVSDATGLATAETVYQIALATADDGAAHAWANSDGSAPAAFDAAYADAELSWLNATAPAYIADQTAQAQADADYANEAATLDASQTSDTTAQDGTLAVTQALLDQTEQDTIAADEQTSALAETSENGADIAGRTTALADRALADAQDVWSWLLTEANNASQRDIAVATNSPYTPPPFDNSYAIAEADANLDWVDATTQADSSEQTTLATAGQTRGDDEATAQQTYTQAAADAQWTHDQTVDALQEATAATLAGDEQTREETYATADATLETAEYTDAASAMSSLTSAVNTPWTEYLAGLAGATATWWSSNVAGYLSYQDTLAADQATDSTTIAQAVETQADAQTDADRTLAYAQAGAADTQATADDAAQQTEQLADAANDVIYQQGIAQAQVDYQTLLPDVVAANNADESDISAADQNYLAAELNAQDSLTTTTAGDALTDSTALANAQLAWTEAGDADTEAYLYSSSQADDVQSDADAHAAANYQTASSAGYAAAVVAFDQANASPWADYASALAAAQATLTAGTAGASAAEQIALADADFAQSTADALAQQTLDDAQAVAATNLSIAEETAESDLNTAQTLFANAMSYQNSTTSSELPNYLYWSANYPLTAWEYAAAGSSPMPRQATSLPLAWPYQAGYSPAAGFGVTNLAGAPPWMQWDPAGGAEGPNNSYSPVVWPSWPIYETTGGPVLFAGPGNDLATQAVGVPDSYAMDAFGDVLPFGGGVMPPAEMVFYSGPIAQPLSGPAFSVEAPVPDDTAHQDYEGDTTGMGFDNTPLGQLSDQSQPTTDATPTADQQVQETETTAANDAATSNDQALQAAVQSVNLSANMNDIPIGRIGQMWEQGMANYYKPDPEHMDKTYAYVADALGSDVVIYVFKQSVQRTSYDDGSYDYYNAYSLIYTYTVSLDESNYGVDEMLAYYRTQEKANYFIQMAMSQEQTNHAQAVSGRLELALNLVPFGGAADNFTQAFNATNAQTRQKFLVEGSISLAGDLATVASFGVGTTIKTGGKAVAIASRQTVRNVRIGAAVIDGSTGVARAVQGAVALYNGEGGAMGYFGEATLMLLGASSSLIAEIKAARLATGCFFAGTPVATQMGYAAVETVSVNDPVYAYDFSSGVWVFGRVVETYQNDYIGEKIRIKVQGDWIESTRHHPVWVISGNDLENRPRPEHVVRADEDSVGGQGRWVDACDLQVGDVLLTKDRQGADCRTAGRATIDAIEVEFVAAKVYNFQVEGLHNYAVGYWQVLVHNNAPCIVVTSEELARTARRIPGNVVSYEVGVQLGREYATTKLHLREVGFVNPREFHGKFGQGIDDVMENAAGDLVIVEYKGGTGRLADGQMEKSWVRQKIKELRLDGSPWGAKLQAALDAGKLEGVAISSTEGPNGVSTVIFGPRKY